METAVVTGATGFIGKRLVRALRESGAAVTALTRDPARAAATLGAEGVECVAWDAPQDWRPLVRDADAVFHLAGEPVAGKRWTPEYKERVLRSRTETTADLVGAGPRGAFVSASAVGYYGDRGDRTVTEESGPADDFLARVCVAWEAEAQRATATAARVVLLRIGIVLGDGGGPLAAMLPPFKAGVGGPMGSGRQWVPWVHVDDVVGLALFAAGTAAASGPINAVAPDPVTNAQLAAAIGRALGKPALLPLPAVALRAAVGEMAYALLYSQRVLPARAQALGYPFRFADVSAALADILPRA